MQVLGQAERGQGDVAPDQDLEGEAGLEQLAAQQRHHRQVRESHRIRSDHQDYKFNVSCIWVQETTGPESYRIVSLVRVQSQFYSTKELVVSNKEKN